MAERSTPPSILAAKTHDAPSVFRPENLLREARRQRGLPDAAVPAVCVLDPDGDIVRALRAAVGLGVQQGWACYHTEMDVTEHAGVTIGHRRAWRWVRRSPCWWRSSCSCRVAGC